MQNLKLLFAVIGGTLLLIFGASWFFSWQTQQVQEKAEQVVAEDRLVPADAHIKGATESAKFTIVEFSDFQCPACATMSGPVAALVEQYKSNTRLVYRHFPLLSIHKNAYLAASAGEAAARQGKFWEMHDQLFATQNEWKSDADPADFFTALAKDLGMNEEQFAADLKSDAVKSLVDRDLNLSSELSLASTPTFYLNGKKMDLSEIEATLRAGSSAQ